MEHTETAMHELVSILLKFDDELKVVMEATGIYHLPILTYLADNGIFILVINPYQMKKYRTQGLRSVKTDKHDSITISNYGIDRWFRLENYRFTDELYSELKLLGRQYMHYMRMRVESVLSLTHLLDYTMPGIKELLNGWNEASKKDKLSDFVEKYWHFNNITRMSEEEFINDYAEWAKSKGYYTSPKKASKIYQRAIEGIPTLSSNTPSTKMLVLEAVRVLREVYNTLYKIITQMQELAKRLPEYSVVRNMGGIGDVLAPKLIAEIGDVRRFHNGKALIAYAGIDAPPYQSGKFIGTQRKISKRGSAALRKVGY